MMRRHAGSIGAVFGLIAVALGAFAAHALKARLSANALEWFRTGVEYQFWHALAIIALARAERRGPAVCACSAFAIGIVLFSGSLYGLALAAPEGRWFGAITPFGGVSFLVGWVLAIAALWPRTETTERA
ncbi:MAG: DUF423 domain-containing protein [Planctomycetota bacterium]